jgi:hypothetical protein
MSCSGCPAAMMSFPFHSMGAWVEMALTMEWKRNRLSTGYVITPPPNGWLCLVATALRPFGSRSHQPQDCRP